MFTSPVMFSFIFFLMIYSYQTVNQEGVMNVHTMTKTLKTITEQSGTITVDQVIPATPRATLMLIMAMSVVMSVAMSITRSLTMSMVILKNTRTSIIIPWTNPRLHPRIGWTEEVQRNIIPNDVLCHDDFIAQHLQRQVKRWLFVNGIEFSSKFCIFWKL